jgi:hypothetical protein
MNCPNEKTRTKTPISQLSHHPITEPALLTLLVRLFAQMNRNSPQSGMPAEDKLAHMKNDLYWT